jgi:hypothetical protein
MHTRCLSANARIDNPSPVIAADRRKLPHSRPTLHAQLPYHDPGHPDRDQEVGPNQIGTTPRHHTGGASSSRPRQSHPPTCAHSWTRSPTKSCPCIRLPSEGRPANKHVGTQKQDGVPCRNAGPRRRARWSSGCTPPEIDLSPKLYAAKRYSHHASGLGFMRALRSSCFATWREDV